MKWKDFRAWMNEFFDDNDDIRITLTNEYKELNDDIKDIYPVITIITQEESKDDGGYQIFVASDLEEREEGYYAWSHEDITDFAKNKQTKRRCRMSPYKIKYRVITANAIEDTAADNWFDEYDKALEMAGKYLSERGCVAMDLMLVGHRRITDDGDVVLYKQEIFSAAKGGVE